MLRKGIATTASVLMLAACSAGQNVRTDAGSTWEAHEFATRAADIVLVTPTPGTFDLPGHVDLVYSPGNPVESDAYVHTGSVTELADLLADWHALGVPGFRLRGELDPVTRELVPLLRRRGLFEPKAGTLRERLGLAPAINRYEQGPTLPKRVILAAHFPGVNNTTVWSDPDAGSQIEFASFEHLARTAERGKFDFFFLAEGLALREQRGRIHDLDVVGRPDTLTVLAALAGVTTRLGLAGTLNATFHEPYELARQLATLDHLSGGRAAWNVVTSSGPFFGANFRRGGFLPYEQRYERAGEFIRTAKELWDTGGGEFRHRGDQFDIIEVTGRQNFIGTPARVAELLNEYVQTDACDGFILVPHLTPTGLDEFVDTVVPLLQERGVFRTEYTSSTLRGHLGLS
ncbi:LLM class flavin-dependent oxidoreductase [Actinoplanes sp. NPDC051470]|uniref:LLM class flavin-dependent oxidoreductase n=1 Tax=Actinoplanes sp. NPDC051470 TaxID=3157224 RepID=UPI00342E5FFE